MECPFHITALRARPNINKLRVCFRKVKHSIQRQWRSMGDQNMMRKINDFLKKLYKNHKKIVCKNL